MGRAKFYQKQFFWCLLLIVFFPFCRGKRKHPPIENVNSLSIEYYRNLPQQQLTEIKFESDTFFYKLSEVKDTIIKRIPGINTGKNTLHIASISASCGCTKASVNKKLVMPGEDFIVDLKFAPKQKEFSVFFTIIGNIPKGVCLKSIVFR